MITEPSESGITLRKVLQPITLVGGLYACGFIIETAHEDLLGVSLDVSPLAYLVTAGTFLLDLVRFLASWLYTMSLWLCLVGLIAVSVAVASKIFRMRHQDAHNTSTPQSNPDSRKLGSRARLLNAVQRRHGLAAWITSVLLVAKVIYFDAPVFAFSNLLFQELHPNQPSIKLDLGNVFQEHTNAIWNDLLCTRVDCGTHDMEFHVRSNRNRFLLDLLVTAVLGISMVALFADDRTGKSWALRLTNDLTMLVVVATFFVALSLVPYCYGKMLYPTEVTFAQLEMVSNRDKEITLEGYLLSENSDTLKLFMPSDEWKVHEFRKAQIQAVKTNRRMDVLKPQIKLP